MGGGNKATSLPFSTTRQYGWETPPETEYSKQLAAYEPDSNLSPDEDYEFAQREQQLNEGYDSPYAGFTNPVARERQKELAMNKLYSDRGVRQAQAKYNANILKLGQLQTLAELNKPQLMETSNYGYGSAPNQSNGVGAAAISGGSMIGAAAITALAA